MNRSILRLTSDHNGRPDVNNCPCLWHAGQHRGLVTHVRFGFTLIELLVVISIIALLISILLPALRQARNTANAIKCATGLKQISVAAMLYTNDFHDYLPPAQSPADGTLKYELLICNYLSYDLAYLQSIRQRADRDTKPSLVYFCPSNAYSQPYSVSNYTLNVNRFVNPPTNDWSTLKRLSDITNPTITVAQTDLRDRRVDAVSESAGMSSTGHLTWYNVYNVVNYDVHMGSSNFIFMDGHEKRIGPDTALDMNIEF